MKRKHLVKRALAGILSAAMAFSMTPNVGLVSVPAFVQAAEGGNKITYVNAPGKGTASVPDPVTLADVDGTTGKGMTNALPNLKDSANAYVLSGWDVAVNDELESTFYIVGSKVPYDAIEKGKGLKATAVWTKGLCYNTGDQLAEALPDDVILKENGGSVKLADSLTISGDTYRFKDWEVKIGSEAPIYLKAGDTLKYSAVDRDKGIVATAKWSQVLSLTQDLLSDAVSANTGDFIVDKMYNGNAEWSGKLTIGGKEVKLTGTYDRATPGTRTLNITNAAVYKQEDGVEVVDDDYVVVPDSDTLLPYAVNTAKIVKRNKGVSDITFENAKAVLTGTKSFEAELGTTFDGLIKTTSDYYTDIELWFDNGKEDTDGNTVYEQVMPTKKNTPIPIYISANGNGYSADIGTASVPENSEYTLTLIDNISPVTVNEKSFSYNGEDHAKEIIDSIDYDEDKLGIVTLRYTSVDDEGMETPETDVTDAGTYRVYVDGATKAGVSGYSAPINYIAEVTVAPKSISDVTVTLGSAPVYDVKEAASTEGIKAVISVSDEEINDTLSEDIEYEISYSNNKSATDKAIATLTGIGNYTGTKVVEYTIDKAADDWRDGKDTITCAHVYFGETPEPTGLAAKSGNAVVYYYYNGGTTVTNTTDADKIPINNWKTADNTKFVKSDNWFVKGVVAGSANYTELVSAPATFKVNQGTATGILNYGTLKAIAGESVVIDLADAIKKIETTDTVDLAGASITPSAGASYVDELNVTGTKLTIPFKSDLSGLTTTAPLTIPITKLSKEENCEITLTVYITLMNKDMNEVKPEITVTGSTYGDKLENGQLVETHTVKVGNVEVTKNLTVKYGTTEAADEEYASVFTSDPANAGTYYIRVIYSDEENAVYGEAVKEFEIAKRPITITAENKTYDAGAEGAYFGLVEFTTINSITKLPNESEVELEGDIEAVLEDETCDGTKNGTYVITVDNQDALKKANPNYDITFVDGTLTVTGNAEEETPVDAEAALAEAKALIAEAEKLPSTKADVTDIEAAKATIASVEALDKALTADERAAITDAEVTEALGKIADKITAAKTAVAEKGAEKQDDQKQDDQKQDDQKQDDQNQGGSGEGSGSGSGSGSDSATTGSSTDVTPSNGGGSGSSGGGGGSSNAKTVKNADGSTTTTTTTAKGTIETTTKTNADGSKTTSKVVKNKDGSGSVTETSVSAAGTTKVVEVVTDTTGAATEVTTSVSNSKGASMKVTYAAKGTAITVSKVETTGKTAVSIPATVKVGGKTYKVTKIAASALKGNKEITKVTLGKNVKAIGKNAFNGDSKLKTIVMKKAPTTVGKNAFKGIAKKATIKIKATKKAFKTAKKLIKKSGIASTVKIKRTK